MINDLYVPSYVSHNLYLDRVTAKLAHFWYRNFGTKLCANDSL